MVYADGRIAKLARELARAGVAEAHVERIMEGADAIGKLDKPERKAEWLGEAMRRMGELLDRETRQSVREGCACCLSGKRLEISKGIAKQHSTLEERIAAANEARFVFGHSVTLQDDGRVLVLFSEEGLPSYRCVCLPRVKERLSVTYCYCCGGQARSFLLRLGEAQGYAAASPRLGR
jgi:hypothetical protein